jgi:hypothetical protein
MSRRIRVSSQALGCPATVNVFVYGTRESMLRAAHRFNRFDTTADDGVLAVTQAVFRQDVDASGAAGQWRCAPIVRLVRGSIGLQIVAHEMLHAATAIYGASLPEETTAREVLTNCNEPFTHLYDELLTRIVERLRVHHYYETETAEG